MSDSRPSPAASIKKNSLIATSAIILSRFFGLAREQVFAFFFGAGMALDAFVAAFRIPNLLRDLFAEGALSQSFVAVFAKKNVSDEREAFQLANKISTLLTLFMTALVVIGIVFSPQIVGVIAHGFTGDKFDLTVALNRVMFPFILFVSLAALSMGMLNAKGRFFLPQSASTFFNIVAIMTGLAAAWYYSPAYMRTTWMALIKGERPSLNGAGVEQAIIGMAVGTLAGGIAQWISQSPALWRLGYRPRFDFDPKHPDVATVLKLTGPAIIGGAAVQVNVMVNTYFASFLEHGSISYLNYAFRLMQFPLGVFGVAIATASAPALAALLARGEKEEFVNTLRSSLSMSLFLSLPSTVGLMVLAEPVISLVYEHGRFDALDTLATAYALLAYAPGIASYSLIKIYQPAFLAHGDAKTPMRIALFSIALNVAVNWFFLRVLAWQYWGLALGTSLVATVNLLLLALSFGKKSAGLWSASLVTVCMKTLTSCLVMGVAAYGILHAIDAGMGAGDALLLKLGRVLLPMAAAAPVYFGCCRLLRVSEVLTLGTAIRKRLSF